MPTSKFPILCVVFVFAVLLCTTSGQLRLVLSAGRDAEVQSAAEPHHDIGSVADAGADPNSLNDVATGLVGYWTMDDGSGPIARDSSGNGNTGWLSASNLPVWQPLAGRLDGALLFDGTGGYVVNEDVAVDVNGLDALTISAWVRSNTTGTDSGFIIFETPQGRDNRDMRYDAVGAMSGREDVMKCGIESSEGKHEVESSALVQTTEWQHLAMTWKAGEAVRIYVDGLLDAGAFTNQPIRGGALTGYTHVLVGKGGKDTRNTSWNGLIDEVAIFERTLSPTEISRLHTRGGASFVNDGDMLMLWELDESSGTIATDSSGNGYDGTLTAHNTPTWQAGIMGDALMFHGLGTYVDCGNGPAFNVTNEMSVAAWVNISSVPEYWTGIVTKGDDSWRLSTFENQRRFHFAVTSPAAGPNWVNGDFEVPTDEWSHVVGTYDGTYIRLYVNSVEDTGSPAAYTGTVDTSVHNVWIGGNSDRPGREFHGGIDEVAVWNRSLSASEIALLYNGGLGNPIISPTTYYVDDDAPNDPNPGNPLISDPFEDGSPDHPFDAIQEAINVAVAGDTVIVRDGTYTGPGNRDITFMGKAILVRSENGPENCIINCEGTIEEDHVSFLFISGENESSILNGFKIINGFSQEIGGGIYCFYSSPTIINCIISFCRVWQAGGAVFCNQGSPHIIGCAIVNNRVTYGDGGGISCWGQSYPTITDCTIAANTSYESGGGISCRLGGEPTIRNCTIGNNRPDGIGFLEGDAVIEGTVWMVSNNLTSDGVLEIQSGAILDLDESHISCDVIGLGTIRIPLGRELIIKSDASVSLDDPCAPDARGTIQCDGLLRVKDDAVVSNANVNVLRAIFEDNAIITGNTFATDARMPYGHLALKDASMFVDNDVHAGGDRYIDVAPGFAGILENIRVYVTITEGHNRTPPGLFEARGRDEDCFEPPCDPGIFQVEFAPDFDVNSWTLQQLEVADGARLTLTDRFDNLYGSGEDKEVIYVKHLVLGAYSVLDTAFNRLYYESIDAAPSALVKNEPLRAFSLHKIALDSQFEFVTQVRHNNDERYGRIHVERVEGLQPDPTGMIRLTNRLEPDPNSPNYGEPVNARAKGLFSNASEGTVLVRFNYMFDTYDPDARLEIWASDVPELLDYNDPARDEHYIHVGSVPAPASGLAGAFDSERFGVFRKRISTGELNLINGLWIEFEFIGPPVVEYPMAAGTAKSMSDDNGSAFLDDLWPAIWCDGICLDLNYDTVPTEGDFLMVVGACGHIVDINEGDDSTACLDGFFSADGFADTFDLISWDWALNSGDFFAHFCGVPLSDSTESTAAGASGGPQPLSALFSSLSDLLIAGKRNKSSDPSQLRLKDGLYVFDDQHQYAGSFAPASDRCNIRLVKDLNGKLYQLNSEDGLLSLDNPNDVIVSPDQITGYTEPRYSKSATVYVGIQGEGEEAIGRPILDAAFDSDYVYVVPVVVSPDDGNFAPYAAAARLNVPQDANLPYEVAQLYYDPPLAGDNRDCNALREIEVDSTGNVYVLNVHRDNEADILWKYDPDGSVLTSLSLSGPSGVADFNNPVGLYVSNTTDMVYLASAQYNLADINSTVIHGFSKQTLAVERSITVNGMQHVSSITEEPTAGCLWVAGFNMGEIPDWPLPEDPPFYYPYLAKIPYDSNSAQAVDISDPNDDDYLALPMSIVWTKSVKCAGANIDGIDDVTFTDFAVLALAWLSELGEAEWNPDCNISIPPDGLIDERDLATLANHWLDTECAP